MDSKGDPKKPDYKKHLQHKLTVEQLDNLANEVLDRSGKLGTIKRIYFAVLLLAIFAYFWTRRKIVKEQLLAEKQILEQEQNLTDQEEFGKDDMDVEKN